MDADLVGAAGFKLALDEGDVAEPFHHSVVGDGMFALFTVGEDGHYEAVARVAAHVPDDGAFVLFEVAPHEGAVLAVNGVVEEVGGQLDLRLLRLGHDQNAGGVLVDTVQQQWLDLFAILIFLSLKMIGEGIDERAVVVTESRVHHHAGRLVDDDEVIVLVHDVERDVLGDNLEIAGRTGQQDGNDIVGVYAVVRLLRLPVHKDTIGFGGFLYAVP